jgi:hypothetical protein
MSLRATSGWSGTVEDVGIVRLGGHRGAHYVEALSWLIFGN